MDQEVTEWTSGAAADMLVDERGRPLQPSRPESMPSETGVNVTTGTRAPRAIRLPPIARQEYEAYMQRRIREINHQGTAGIPRAPVRLPPLARQEYEAYMQRRIREINHRGTAGIPRAPVPALVQFRPLNTTIATAMTRQLPKTLTEAFDGKLTSLSKRIITDDHFLVILLDKNLIRRVDKERLVLPIKTEEERSSELIAMLEKLCNSKVCEFFTALHESKQDGVLEDVLKFKWQDNGEFVTMEETTDETSNFITRLKDELTECVDVDFGLLDKVLDNRTKAAIICEPNAYVRIDKFLGSMAKGDDQVHQKLIDGLWNTEQQHVMNFIEVKEARKERDAAGNVWPLTKEQRILFEHNRFEWNRLIGTRNAMLLGLMVDKMSITSNHRDHIVEPMLETNLRDITLADILRRRSIANVHGVFDCIAQVGHDRLAGVLKNVFTNGGCFPRWACEIETTDIHKAENILIIDSPYEATFDNGYCTVVTSGGCSFKFKCSSIRHVTQDRMTILIEKGNSLELYFYCASLSAYQRLLELNHTQQLRTILEEIFTLNVKPAETIRIKKLIWDTSSYYRCRAYFAALSDIKDAYTDGSLSANLQSFVLELDNDLMMPLDAEDTGFYLPTLPVSLWSKIERVIEHDTPRMIAETTFVKELAGKESHLEKKIDAEHGLLTKLKDIGLLTNKQVINCEKGKEDDEVEKRMLFYLKKADDARFGDFCVALIETNQQHIVRDYFPSFAYLIKAETSPARPGNTIRTIEYNDLQQPQAITQGGFGVLYRARHDQWGDVAYKELSVKIIDEDDRIGRELKREAQMFKLNHPNILKLLGIVFEPGHYGLIFEFAQFGGLDNFLTKYDIGFSLKMSFAVEILEGMTYLHSLKPPVIHGDLKLRNVLVSVGYIAKICDFGLAKWKTFTTQQTSSTSGRAGSVTHFAPAIWNNLLSSRTETFDVYSFGILLWELLSEPVPYQEARSNVEMIRLAVLGGQRPPLKELKCPEILSAFVKGVIERCWNQEPEDRPAFRDLRHELRQFIDEHALTVDYSKPAVELRKQDNS